MSIDVQCVDSVRQVSAAMTPSARYIAGGTILMRQVNYGDQNINRLILCNDSVLSEIQSQGDIISIGAGVKISQILRHPDLQFLSQAARSVGGPAIRNMATVGGNLFAPRPYGDLTVVLLALDATVHWANGEQQTLEQFLEQPIPNDIVVSVSIRQPATGDFRYLKVSRVKPKGVSLITIAALLSRENGRIGKARIAFGGMSPRPRRALAAELALQGATLDESGVLRCVDSCREGLTPADDALASAWYRNEVAPVYLQRLLLQRTAI